MGFVAKVVIASIGVYVINKKLRETGLLEEVVANGPQIIERVVTKTVEVLNGGLTAFAQAQEAARAAATAQAPTGGAV